MDDTKEKLEKSIKLAKYRLKQFNKDFLATDSGNIAYNRLLIEKAIMVEKLKGSNQNKLTSFAKKICRKITGKKLICDSF